MCTYDIIAVSNRLMCGNFIGQIKKITAAGVPVILREKDLSEEAYERLAKEVMEICPDVILHTFTDAARRIGGKRVHLPMSVLRTADLTGFEVIGASVHSAEEAVEAQKLGSTYITAGHIFETDCKRGLAPRGVGFLNEVCEAVTIPVYAIGGITPNNAKQAFDAGAAGVCVMSGLMKCADVSGYVNNIRRER